jgi:hypothetical protein
VHGGSGADCPLAICPSAIRRIPNANAWAITHRQYRGRVTVSSGRHGGAAPGAENRGTGLALGLREVGAAMVDARRASLVLGLLSLAAGCGDGPPLDELPLRDALRAEPGVVAALPAPARVQLAARLEAARTGDAGSDPVIGGAQPGVLVGALDDARARRSADALIVGAIGGGVGRPIAAAAASSDQQPLPPLEGPAAADTARLEARALAGAAAGPLRGLVASSGASRLERVVGWPVGAVAIGDTIYVDASWLVALAPADPEGDGGADGAPGADAVPATSGASAATAVTPASVSYPIDGGNVFIGVAYSFDAGTSTPPPPPPPPPPSNSPSFWDACAATGDASDSCDTSSCDSTDDGSDSSCSGSTDDGSADACSAPPPDDGSSCRVAPGRERSRPSTLVWVLAPLGFLVGRRR